MRQIENFPLCKQQYFAKRTFFDGESSAATVATVVTFFVRDDFCGGAVCLLAMRFRISKDCGVTGCVVDAADVPAIVLMRCRPNTVVGVDVADDTMKCRKH